MDCLSEIAWSHLSEFIRGENLYLHTRETLVSVSLRIENIEAMEIKNENIYQFYETTLLPIIEVPKSKLEVKVLELHVRGGI